MIREEVITNDIGKKLKHLRLQRGMTLRDLGTAVNLSAGYLSQLERGMSSIAINHLAKIAKCLGTNIGYFISDGYENECPVMKTYEQELLYVENNLSIEYKITHNIKSKTMMPKLVVMQPGFSTELAHCHEGEEFIYVLEGNMVLGIEGKEYDLYPGDTAHIDSIKEHTWSNRTNKTVKLLAINTPNPFNKE